MVELLDEQELRIFILAHIKNDNKCYKKWFNILFQNLDPSLCERADKTMNDLISEAFIFLSKGFFRYFRLSEKGSLFLEEIHISEKIMTIENNADNICRLSNLWVLTVTIPFFGIPVFVFLMGFLIGKNDIPIGNLIAEIGIMIGAIITLFLLYRNSKKNLLSTQELIEELKRESSSLVENFIK